MNFRRKKYSFRCLKIDKWDKWDNKSFISNEILCGRQPLKNLKEYGLPKADHTPSYFLKVVFHKFYLVHSWILRPKCSCRLVEVNFYFFSNTFYCNPVLIVHKMMELFTRFFDLLSFFSRMQGNYQQATSQPINRTLYTDQIQS